MPLVPDDDMIETLASDGADDPFDITVLPGRSRCRWYIVDSHRFYSIPVEPAVGAVSITDNIARHLVRNRSFRPWNRPVDGCGRCAQPADLLPRWTFTVSPIAAPHGLNERLPGVYASSPIFHQPCDTTIKCVTYVTGPHRESAAANELAFFTSYSVILAIGGER